MLLNSYTTLLFSYTTATAVLGGLGWAAFTGLTLWLEPPWHQ
jgi:hypothetical protein